MSPEAVWIKICGITCVEDAEIALDAGADAVGLNFVPGSRRSLQLDIGRRIADQVRGRLEIVGVIADVAVEEARKLRAELGLDALQLHGHESAEDLEALLPGAFKAIRLAGAEDVELALGFPGERLLVDAWVAGRLGGTGGRADPLLCRQVAQRRRVILAGGLTPENVAEAIRSIRPWGVDVAGGVEADDSRRKSAERVRDFVRAARGAAP